MIVNKYTKGGGGSGSGVTPEQVQAQIDSALTYYWESGITKEYVDSADTIIYASATSRMDDVEQVVSSALNECHEQIMEVSAATSGKANAKILVDFDKTPQSERAALYADLKALYDGGSGSSINKLYDFYKTVNTWQGQKIDYYTFSGNTLVFGQVVSPENVTDQVVYVQVMEIDSAGNVNVVTNAIGASGGGVSQEYVDSAVTILQDQLDTIDQVAAAAFVDLNERVDEISASTPSIDLSGYYTSAQTEDAISAATSGKADAANVSANTNKLYFPQWNEQGVITGNTGGEFYFRSITINGTDKTFPCYDSAGSLPAIYAPTTSGNPGEFLVADGTNTPKWSAVTMGGVSQEYVDSAITQVQDQLDLIDDVIPAAIVDINNRMVSSSSVSTLWSGTQAQYDAIITKDPNTLYIIVNSN